MISSPSAQHQKREETAQRINESSAGPACASRPPAPRNRPVPIAPPMANHLILTWLEGLVVTEFLFDEDLTFGRRRFPRMMDIYPPDKVL